MGQRYEALHGGGSVAKTSKKSVTYFMDGPLDSIICRELTTKACKVCI